MLAVLRISDLIGAGSKKVLERRASAKDYRIRRPHSSSVPSPVESWTRVFLRHPSSTGMFSLCLDSSSQHSSSSGTWFGTHQVP